MNIADGPKILKRDITPEIREQRQKDMQEVLDNYRENLHNHGATDEAAIDQFLAGEQAKMEKEYESLDKGDCSSDIYHEPTDWDGIASGMSDHEAENENEDEDEMCM